MDEKTLSKLIEIDTSVGKSNLRIINYLEIYFSNLRYKTRKWGDGNQRNLFVYKPTYLGRIVLAAHTDTVQPVGGWRSNPLSLSKNGDHYFGLGVCDMKGFIAVMCEIAEKINNDRLAFLFTYNEESDFAGAKNVDRKIIGKRDIIILGEPTDGEIVLATKGLVNCSLEVTGKPAHGSAPRLGVSAILDSARLIMKLKQMFDAKFEAKNAQDKLFDIPQSTYNFGRIRGGSADNVVPERCEMSLEIRTVIDNFDYKSLIAKTAKNLGIVLEITENLNLPTFRSAINAVELRESMVATDMGKSYCTEANIYQQFCPKCIIFGPGNIKYAHAPNEKIKVDGFRRYERDLTKLIIMLI